MVKNMTKDWGPFLMRVIIATIFLYHGIPKALFWGIANTKFIAMGFPGFLGPIVGVVEVIGAVLLLTGAWFKYANYALAIIVGVAIVGVQLPGALEAMTFTASLERDFLLITGNILLAWSGPGKFTIVKK